MNEARVTLSRIKKRGTTEMDGIPEDVWMCLGEEGIDMLSIWCKVCTSMRIYRLWRLCV